MNTSNVDFRFRNLIKSIILTLKPTSEGMPYLNLRHFKDVDLTDPSEVGNKLGYLKEPNNPFGSSPYNIDRMVYAMGKSVRYDDAIQGIILGALFSAILLRYNIWMVVLPLFLFNIWALRKIENYVESLPMSLQEMQEYADATTYNKQDISSTTIFVAIATFKLISTEITKARQILIAGTFALTFAIGLIR